MKLPDNSLHTMYSYEYVTFEMYEMKHFVLFERSLLVLADWYWSLGICS